MVEGRERYITAASAAYLNKGMEPTAYRCDVKVVRKEWSYDLGGCP